MKLPVILNDKKAINIAKTIGVCCPHLIIDGKNIYSQRLHKNKYIHPNSNSFKFRYSGCEFLI